MGAGWAKNEVVASKRRCDMIVTGDDGQPAFQGIDFIALGAVFISSATAGKLDLAVGVMRNKRRPLVIDDDVIEAVSTESDTATLTGHTYETGDGPFDSDQILGGTIAIGDDFWIIRVSDDLIAFAASLADAYSNTRVALDESEVGATISDNASTERGLPGEFEYEATQAETNKSLAEQVVIVDGPGYQRKLFGGGHTSVLMQGVEITDWGSFVLEDGLTRDDAMRIMLRTDGADFREEAGGVITYRDMANTKDSHHGTITSSGRSDTGIDDPT